MTATSLHELAPYLASRIFRPNFLRLVEVGAHRRYLDEIGISRLVNRDLTIKELFERVYAVMRESYRSEYLYKNEVIRRRVLAYHDPDSTTVLLEKPIARWASRLDLLVVNNTTTAYEVKTDRDDLSRVRKQTDLALLAFDRVYVACSERWAEGVLETVDDRVGVVRMLATGAFSKVRGATANATRVDPSAVFALLQRAEQVAAIEQYVGPLPAVDAVTHYKVCHDLFRQIPAVLAHKVLLGALRDRFITGNDKETLQGLPPSLPHLYYQASVRERRYLFSPALLGRTVG